MRKRFTDGGVEKLKPRAKRWAFPDPELTGHYVRVQPSGSKSFVAVARSPSGKQVWTSIELCKRMDIEEAREKAREIIKRVRSGLPAVEPASDSFTVVAGNWLRRHVQPNGLRSAKEIVRLLDRHILPAWQGREFVSIRRSDVAALLDHVEDDHGARQADYCLNIVRSIANWYAARNDDYTPPIARGMRRQNPKVQARARILTDDEIRAIWKAAKENGTFGGIIRLALLTAQRRTKVVGMRWADVSVDDIWTIPQEPREKDTAGAILLPGAALNVIRAQPRIGNNPYVFAGRGDGPFNGFSKSKERFDAKCGVSGWTLHDLRRTGRSLLSRAGVRPDVAERVLGHAIPGVAGVYDRHRYDTEKADALARLAALIETIVNPAAGGKVVRLRKAARP